MTEKRFDGTKLISAVTGLSSKEMRDLMVEVKANQAVLDACDDHEFDIPPPFTPGGRATCRNCGGWVDPLKARWYVLGREHEAKRRRDP